MARGAKDPKEKIENEEKKETEHQQKNKPSDAITSDPERHEPWSPPD